MIYTDKTLSCRDCGASFVFTTGEQEFYASRGFTNEPSRCPECRAARKGSRDMGYGRERGAREMHTATCAQCGQEAQVPFVPRGDRPVYCSNCFESQRASRGNRW